MDSNNIKSPLNNSSNVKLIDKINTQGIIDNYRSYYNIDVTNYFNRLNNICVYECVDSGYQFFYPYSCAGNGDFYEQLQNISWYYMPWKWEHKIADKYVSSGMKVLEIGCGKGDFLKIISKKGAKATGIELNKKAREEGIQGNTDILNHSIEEHEKERSGYYDLVCYFQVLEHISDVHSFIKASVNCLTKEGKLIISVPNNDSFIKYAKTENILNMPPHHMGLWTKSSLFYLNNIFELNMERIIYEPLQKHHLNWYLHILDNKLNKSKSIISINRNKHLNHLYKLYTRLFYTFINGHTLLAVYSKK